MLFSIAATSLLFDDEIQNFMTQIITPVKSSMGMKKHQVPVYIIDNSDANASAVGIGIVLIHTGLIKECKNADEFICVIAHELAHLKMLHHAHSLNQSGHSALLGSSLGLGLILAAVTGGISLLMPVVGMQLSTHTVLSQMRVDEFEADQMAAKTLQSIHWPTHGFKTFFERLVQKDFLIKAAGWSTHPLSIERINRINTLTKNDHHYSLPKAVIENFNRIRAKVTGYTQKNTRATNLYERAMALYTVRDFSNALKTTNQLLKSHPHDLYYKELKADILFASGEIEQAKNIYYSLCQQNKNLEFVPLKFVSSAILLKSNLDIAISLLNIQRLRHPNTPYVWHLMGHLYHLKNDEPTMWFCRCQEAYLNGNVAFVNQNINRSNTKIFTQLYLDLKESIKN